MQTQNQNNVIGLRVGGKAFGPKAPRIDVNAGVIYGCSIITAGAADGHPFGIDGTTLEQVQNLGESSPDGIKCQMDHGSGFENIVGVFRGFRIEGLKVVADLFLIKSHESFRRIVEMAQKMPGAFGLSIRFNPYTEEIGGAAYARLTELYSVDLVDDPAANPSGLFSARAATVPAGPPPTFAQLCALAKNVFKITGSDQMDERDLFVQCERAAFQLSVRFHGMATDAELSRIYWRPDASRVRGLSRTERAFKLSAMQAILSSK